MGMTIEDTINTFQHIRNHPKTDEEEVIKFGQELFDTAIDTMRKYQMMQADYENRLKADLVAMLTEIQLEIEELDSRAGYDGNGMPTFANDYVRIIKVNEIIQQKINELKAESEPQGKEQNNEM